MKGKILFLILILLSVAGQPIDTESGSVKIHLPRTVTVSCEKPTLGDICVVRSDQESLQDKAASVRVGRVPWKGEKITWNRNMIAARLASSGILVGQVKFTGAKSIEIQRNEKTLSADRIIEKGREFLEEMFPAKNVVQFQLVGKPKEIVIPDGVDVVLKSALGQKAAGTNIRVDISVFIQGKQTGKTELTFKLIAMAVQSVASRDIERGELLTVKNVTLKHAETDGSANVPIPFGKLAGRRITAGSVIKQVHLTEDEPVVIIRRKQTVIMKIENANLQITALGVALQDGKVGEIIRIKNSDTGRTIAATVMEDGTLKPIFRESGK